MDWQESPIGPLPADWCVARLGDVTVEGTERNQSLKFGREHVLGVDNEEGLIPSDRKLGDDFSRYKLVRRHQFAYNPMRLNVGSIGLWDGNRAAIVSPDYIVFGCQDGKADPEFVNFFRSSAAWKQQVQQSGQGSVRIRYYYRHIAEFMMPLPPLTEQRAIAHVLRTVQHAKEATERVIAAARELKASLMRHLLTYGPVSFDATQQVPLRETQIGLMPAKWPVVTVGELIADGPQNGLYKPASQYGGGSPILRIDAFRDGDTITTQHLKRLRVTTDELALFELREDDLVINRVNGSIDVLAKCALVGKTREPTVFESNMMRLAVDHSRCLPRFVLYFFLSPAAKAQIKTKARVIHQASVNQQDIRSLLIPLPPLEVQQQIADILQQVDDKISIESRVAEAKANLLDSLVDNLMTGRVRVHDLSAGAVGGKP